VSKSELFDLPQPLVEGAVDDGFLVIGDGNGPVDWVSNSHRPTISPKQLSGMTARFVVVKFYLFAPCESRFCTTATTMRWRRIPGARHERMSSGSRALSQTRCCGQGFAPNRWRLERIALASSKPCELESRSW